jgi:diguanylate cyclase (GGDEF)-like protein/PAS domain S-box-containing protein
MGTIWQALIANLAIVALTTSVWSQIHEWLETQRFAVRKGVIGLLIGGGAVASMLMAVEVAPGIVFDLRSPLIAVGALFGGPVVAAISFVIGGAYRLYGGGAGAFIGIANLAMSALGGLLLHRLGRPTRVKVHVVMLLSLWVAGLVVGTMLLLPQPIQLVARRDFVLPASTMSLLATLLIGLTIAQAKSGTLQRRIFQAALLQAPEFQFIKDVKSAFIAANRAVAEHHGFKDPAQLAGKTDFDLEKPDRARFLYEQEQAIIKSGQAVMDMEETIVGPDSSKRSYRTSKVPLRDTENRVIGIAGVTVETTAFKQMERELIDSRDIFSSALAGMSDGLVMFDAKGYLVFCNQQYRDAFPLTAPMRQPGVHVREILQAVVASGEQLQVPKASPQDWIAATTTKLTQENVEDIELFDGRHLQLRTKPAPNGSSLVLVSDVTKLKLAERSLVAANEELFALATTDALTGLANRRTFDLCIEKEVARSAREGGHLSLLMIDVDHFKGYNDRYGHQAGDHCLVKVANALSATIRRPADLAARYGGEEFAIILPSTDEDGAFLVAEGVRNTIRDRSITHEGSEKGQITVSMGLAHFGPNRNSHSAADLIGRADEALYGAKAAGRDQVIGWNKLYSLH